MNSYGHPSVEALQRLRNHGCSLFRTDKQGTVVAYSDGSNIWFNVDECNDWTAGVESLILQESEVIQETAAVRGIPDKEFQGQNSYSYVCNTNTKKFHFPDCNSVNQMKEDNRLYTGLSREELIEQGYEPCGNCNP